MTKGQAREHNRTVQAQIDEIYGTKRIGELSMQEEIDIQRLINKIVDVDLYEEEQMKVNSLLSTNGY